jgi:hypothetical protein
MKNGGLNPEKTYQNLGKPSNNRDFNGKIIHK